MGMPSATPIYSYGADLDELVADVVVSKDKVKATECGRHMCIDMCMDMCMDVCMDTCMDVCMDVCMDMCTDM